MHAVITVYHDTATFTFIVDDGTATFSGHMVVNNRGARPSQGLFDGTLTGIKMVVSVKFNLVLSHPEPIVYTRESVGNVTVTVEIANATVTPSSPLVLEEQDAAVIEDTMASEMEQYMQETVTDYIERTQQGEWSLDRVPTRFPVRCTSLDTSFGPLVTNDNESVVMLFIRASGRSPNDTDRWAPPNIDALANIEPDRLAVSINDESFISLADVCVICRLMML